MNLWKNFEMEFTQEIKIPKDRIPILIGKKGEIKREIQKKLNLKIVIDSESGAVTITGEDGLNVYTGKEIVQAIGRGFNPDTAMILLEDGYKFEQVDITNYDRGSKGRLHELRSRVIGSEGRSKNTIEKIAGVELCVYGKTVAIIGREENVEAAKKAIEKLLGGSKHGNVYGYLERQIKK